MVEVQLPETGVGLARGRIGAEIGNPIDAARLTAVGRDEDAMVELVLGRVGAHEDLVGMSAREPGPVTVVAVRGALVPGLAAVDG